MKELMAKIRKANDAYREGNPIMSDTEYDTLLTKLENSMNMIEFEAFRVSLMETKGAVKLDYVVGSLEKIKFEEPDKLIKWMDQQKVLNLFISAKVDGVSFVATYDKGELQFCASRGDGQSGTDWTAKAKHILPKTIKHKEKLDIRGEFCLTGDSHVKLGMKNRRNGTTGIMGRDDVDAVKLKHVKAKVYEIMNWKQCISDNFGTLRDMGFDCPETRVIWKAKHNPNTINELGEFYKSLKHLDYDTDGLVISDVAYMRENVMLPKGKVAFKVNSEGVETTVIGITWETSKNRIIKPVLRVTPTDINGTTVSNVTGNNLRFMEEAGLGIGAKIKIIRSGEVIPKVVDVVTKAKVTVPTACPACGGKVYRDGVDIRCDDIDCGAAMVKKVEAFIKSLEIENVSESRLIEWNVTTFDALLAFTPDKNYKTQMVFFSELNKKLFRAHPVDIMRAFSIEGIGTSTYDKLIKHFGSLLKLNQYITSSDFNRVNRDDSDLPAGVGIKTIDKGRADWQDAYEVLAKICTDKRYVKPTPKPVIAKALGKLSGKTFMITGTLSVPRKQIEDKITAAGGEIASSVNKTLSFLVAGDKAGSKLDKANKLGVKVITEAELEAMI